MRFFLLFLVFGMCGAFAQESALDALMAKRDEAVQRLDAATAEELKVLAKQAAGAKNIALAAAASNEALRLVPIPEADAPAAADSLPREVEIVMEKREVKKKGITAVYLKELEKLLAKYTGEGNVALASKVGEEIKRSTPVQEKLGSDLLNHDQGKNKVALNAKVLQVLDDGLLFSGDGGYVYILKNYPDQRKTVDGMVLNCYATRTEEVFTYESVSGAKRTARVYLYFGRRIGK